MLIGLNNEGTSLQVAGHGVQQILVDRPPGHGFGQQEEGSPSATAYNYREEKLVLLNSSLTLLILLKEDFMCIS